MSKYDLRLFLFILLLVFLFLGEPDIHDAIREWIFAGLGD